MPGESRHVDYRAVMRRCSCGKDSAYKLMREKLHAFRGPGGLRTPFEIVEER